MKINFYIAVTLVIVFFIEIDGRKLRKKKSGENTYIISSVKVDKIESKNSLFKNKSLFKKINAKHLIMNDRDFEVETLSKIEDNHLKAFPAYVIFLTIL